MHGVAPERIVVTGAHCYDQWFGRAPSRSRQSFCSRVGLRSDRPYVLYLCSSLFRGTASEAAFVERWVEAIRTSDDPRLKDIGILIRPHPARLDEWKDVDLSGYKNIAFWGAHPVDDEAKNDYFDSMYYSAGVVGLNTSAFLEAAVVGKPVHTVLVDDISKHNQEGTIHFHYLLDVNGGLLRVARTLDEHLACWRIRWRRKAAVTSRRIASSKASSGRSARRWQPRRYSRTPSRSWAHRRRRVLSATALRSARCDSRCIRPSARCNCSC